MIDGRNKDDPFDEDAALLSAFSSENAVIACDCNTGRSYICESACLRLNSKVLIYFCTLLVECLYQNSPLASEETKFFDNPRLR